MRVIVAFLMFVLAASPCSAQVIPSPTKYNLSGTIAVTNTFQSIQPQNNGRIGCTIENNGTHTLYVYFGAIANATTANSFQLSPGQPVSCLVGNGYLLSDQVSITGTGGDAFAAGFQ